MPALQIGVVSAHVGRFRLYDLGVLTRVEVRQQRGNDRGRDLVLYRKYIGEFPIVGFRPEVVAVFDLDQLGRDSNFVPGLAHGPLEHGIDVKLGANIPDRLIAALECKRRGAGGHLQVFQLGQGVQEFFGDAVREILLGRIVTHVDKGEHADGIEALP